MLPDGSLTTAIVLAAGEGTRMRSEIPKVLHPLAGRPLLEHAVRAADIIVLLVDHRQFKRVDRELLNIKIVIDTCGMWR